LGVGLLSTSSGCAIFNDARERRDIVASIDALYGEPCMCIDDAGWSNATCPLPPRRYAAVSVGPSAVR
jgi:hypothetical protein